VRDELQRCRDCWDLLRGEAKKRYLPKEHKEKETFYADRLQRSKYQPFFPDAIREFVGVLSRFQLAEPPASMEQWEDDIDMRGNDVKSFFASCDELVLRDRGCLLMVDMPPGRAENALQEREQGRRPFLRVFPRGDVLSWRTRTIGGLEIPEQVVIREVVEVDSTEGDYGVELETRYRILRGGEWVVVRLKSAGAAWIEEVVLDDDGNELRGTFELSGGGLFPFPPVAWYGTSTRDRFGEGQPPMLSLADQSLDHFVVSSDQRELMRKLALPVPTRTGMPPPAPGMPAPDVVLGSNSIMDLPPGVSFAFNEPGCGSLEARAKEIAHIEELIRTQTLNFLYGGSTTKTATQSEMEAASAQSKISILAGSKHNAIQRVMAIWCAYTGEELQDGAGIHLPENLFNKPFDPAAAQQVVALYDATLTSRRTAIEQLIKGGVITVVTDADEELARLAEEEPPPPPELTPVDGATEPGLPPPPPQEQRPAPLRQPDQQQAA
jgi:hypothetical protein